METVVTIPNFLRVIKGKRGYTQDIIDGTNKVFLKVIYSSRDRIKVTMDDSESKETIIGASIYSSTATTRRLSLHRVNGVFEGTFLTNDVSQMLIDGTVTIIVTTNKTKHNISMLFDDPTYSDVTVQVTGTSATESQPLQLHLHKIILFKYSPVFKTMLLSGMTESVTNIIVIDEFSVSVVHTFFRLMYAGADAIFALQRIDEVEEVWRMSRMYDFKALEEQCEEVMGSSITNSNCLTLLQLAVDMQCDYLKVKCMQYLCLHPTYTARELIDKFGVEGGLELIDTIYYPN